MGKENETPTAGVEKGTVRNITLGKITMPFDADSGEYFEHLQRQLQNAMSEGGKITPLSEINPFNMEPCAAGVFLAAHEEIGKLRAQVLELTETAKTMADTQSLLVQRFEELVNDIRGVPLSELMKGSLKEAEPST